MSQGTLARLHLSRRQGDISEAVGGWEKKILRSPFRDAIPGRHSGVSLASRYVQRADVGTEPGRHGWPRECSAHRLIPARAKDGYIFSLALLEPDILQGHFSIRLV
jgi:hypothetical protein